MRLIMVASPQGLGDKVANIAFGSGIDKVSRRQVEKHEATGAREVLDVVDIETSTPQGKKFVDELLGLAIYDRDKFTVSIRAPRSIISKTPIREITRPLPEPAADITEELFQFAHITYGFIGRFFIAGCLIAYGIIHSSLLVLIAGLLFLPMLPILLGCGFGALTKDWKLVSLATLAYVTAIFLLIGAGIVVGAVSNPPVQFDEIASPGVGFLMSLIVGVAAGLAQIDDAGRRELIGLGASSQLALIPVWFGVCLVLGFPGTVNTEEIGMRALSFFINLFTIVGAASAVFVFAGAARKKSITSQE